MGRPRPSDPGVLKNQGLWAWMEKLRYAARKSVALVHKENMRIEPRNTPTQPQRKEDVAGKYMEGNTFLQNVQLSSSYSRLQHRKPPISHRHNGLVSTLSPLPVYREQLWPPPQETYRNVCNLHHREYPLCDQNAGSKA